MFYFIISYHIISYHIISYHSILYCIIICISYHIISYNNILYSIIIFISCYIMHVSEIQDITILLYWQTCWIRANQMGKMGESEPWAHVATRQTWTNLRVDFQTTDSHNRAPGRSLGSKNWNDEISITSSSNLIWFWAEPLTHALVWVSYGGFLKWEYPKIFHVNRIFHQIFGIFWGTPIYGKPHSYIPNLNCFLCIPQFLNTPTHRLNHPEKTAEV